MLKFTSENLAFDVPNEELLETHIDISIKIYDLISLYAQYGSYVCNKTVLDSYGGNSFQLGSSGDLEAMTESVKYVYELDRIRKQLRPLADIKGQMERRFPQVAKEGEKKIEEIIRANMQTLEANLSENQE